MASRKLKHIENKCDIINKFIELTLFIIDDITACYCHFFRDMDLVISLIDNLSGEEQIKATSNNSTICEIEI
jgi:hypothetical protein